MTDSYVYIQDPDYSWIPAILIKTSEDRTEATVQYPVYDREEDIMGSITNGALIEEWLEMEVPLDNYANGVLPLQNVDANSFDKKTQSIHLHEYRDMCDLSYLHEAAILYNLKLRHVESKPYTRTGDIVIALNPYVWIPGLYSTEKRLLYSHQLVWNYHGHSSGQTSSSLPAIEEKKSAGRGKHQEEEKSHDPRKELEPHVYEVSALSYRGLAFEGDNQSILVSGESGAGKTETVKICLNHIASVQLGNPNHLTDVYLDNNEQQQDPLQHSLHADACGEATMYQGDPVVQRVVESNPLLEAFGNAKTRRNDNSSRFGKYLKLQFFNKLQGFSAISNYSTVCALVGSSCQVYLLEKNRVVLQAHGERNFHIFYQLLAAPSDVKARFWSRLKNKTVDDFKYVGDSNLAESDDEAIQIEGKTDAEHFMHTLKALELVDITGETLEYLLHAICVVLQLGNLGFAAGPDHHESGQASSIITTQDELHELANLMELSEETLTKALTERSFRIMGGETHQITLNVDQAKDACDALAKEIYLKTFLWLVDRINAATSVIKTEGQRYGTIGLLDIFGFEVFDVNRFEQLCINYANEKLQQKFTEDIFRNVQEEYHIEGIPLADIGYDDNTNVLDLIEGNTGLLALLNEECVRPKGNDKAFVQKALQINAKSPCLILNRVDQVSFGIRHYAGCVMYDADMFVTRNNDTLPLDLANCAEASKNPIINAPREGSISAAATSSTNRLPGQRSGSSLAAATVWTKYKQQLQALMSDLRTTRSRYIRCVKPNSVKQPILFEHRAVVDQLRCAGVISGITISRSVFPNRLDNDVVLARYASVYHSKMGRMIRAIKSTDTIDLSSENYSDESPLLSQDDEVAEKCRILLKRALKDKEFYNYKGKKVPAFVVGKTRTYFRAGALEWLESTRMVGMDTTATRIQKVARGFLVRCQFRKHKERLAALEKQLEREREEHEARLQRLADESKARLAETQKEEDDILAEIERIQKAIIQDEKQTHEELRKLEAEKDDVDDEIFELKRKTSDDAVRVLKEPRRIFNQQENILEEQQKIISVLQKENLKAKKETDKIKGKIRTLEENIESLYEDTTHFEDQMEEEVGKFNRISTENEQTKLILAKERATNNELKFLVQDAQDVYMAEAEARVELQRGLAQMLEVIQNGKYKETRMVEKAVVIAVDCQTAAQNEMAKIKKQDEVSRPGLTSSDFDSSLSMGED